MATTLLARGITLSRGTAVVLDDISIQVAPHQRIGVLGPNGTGKTTLLRVLAGALRPDSGTVSLSPARATVGYLPQEPDRRDDESVAQFLARRTGVAEASAALDEATAALGQATAEVADAYDAALERWMDLGGADLDVRTGEVLHDLDLDGAILEQATATLSGGQAARVSLAGILLARFDLFLLDEPTNDLDFDGLARLEAFVAKVDAGVVVVSHDRAFLERVVTDVVELDEHSHRASLYSGGWEAYLDARATARRHAREAFEGYQSQRQDLEQRARTQREWSVQGVKRAKNDADEKDKSIRAFRKATSEKVASKARATDRARERLDVVDKPWEGWELHMEIATAPRSGSVVARLDGAVVRRGGFTLGPVTLEVGWAERVAIVGPNGAGKSTLLDALLGRIELGAGESWIGPGVVVGTLEQGRSRFLGPEPLLDRFTAASGLLPLPARTLLAKFGLGASHVSRPARSLSPGERTRASLALFMASGVNCLVLDEPTNHLDLTAIEQLEQAVDTYDGTLLLVTHDRRLLEAVRVDRTLRVEAGRVHEA